MKIKFKSELLAVVACIMFLSAFAACAINVDYFPYALPVFCAACYVVYLAIATEMNKD